MTVVAILLGYLIGAIPFAVVVGRLYGIDVQRSGSGNAGAKNTFVTAGRRAGVLVALLDAAKAALAIVLGRLLVSPDVGALAGVASVAGHCFSPFLALRWRGRIGADWKTKLRRLGGKGLASGLMALLLIAWPSALVAVAVFGLGLLVLRRDETWPTLIALAASVPTVWLLTHNVTTTAAVLLVAVIVAIKHLPDVKQAFSAPE